MYSDAGTPIAFDNTPAQHPVDTDGVVSEGVVLSSGVFKGDASKADKAALCRDVYDFSQNSEIVRALTNCVSSLGGTVVNSPLYNGENWWGLHFIADTARTKIKLIRTGNPPTVQLKYSLDWGSTWNTYTMGTDITLTNAGDGVCFAAADDVTNESFTNNADNYTKFVITGSAGAYGDISSLIKDDEDAWLLPLGTRQYQ